jgi:hypothetical protein
MHFLRITFFVETSSGPTRRGRRGDASEDADVGSLQGHQAPRAAPLPPNSRKMRALRMRAPTRKPAIQPRASRTRRPTSLPRTSPPTKSPPCVRPPLPLRRRSCRTGTVTCNRCENSPACWSSKSFTACGSELCRPSGTQCNEAGRHLQLLLPRVQLEVVRLCHVVRREEVKCEENRSIPSYYS